LKTASRNSDFKVMASIMLGLSIGGVLFTLLGVHSLSLNYGSGYAFKVTNVCLESWDYPTQYWDFSFVMKNTGSEPITSISVDFAGSTLRGGLWDPDQYGYQTWEQWTGPLYPGQVVFGEWRTSSQNMTLPGTFFPGDSYSLSVIATLESGKSSVYSGSAMATDDPLSCPIYQP